MDILVDFDGTCVAHEFPKVGQDIGAQKVLKRLVEAGHRLILFTMRSNKKAVASNDPEIHTVPGQYLDDAVAWFKENNIPLYGIQTNPTQHTWTESTKAYGQLHIDDCGLGIPLIHPPIGKPYVDWESVEYLLECQGVLQDSTVWEADPVTGDDTLIAE